MKPFLVWLVLALLGFGGLAGGYHGYLQDNPRRIAVVVDTSYDMTAVWPRVEPELTQIGAARYSAFSLITDKRVIHSWQPRLRASLAEPYGPRDFAKLRELASVPEITGAETVFFLTNAPAADIAPFSGWQVISLAR
jgi:hypothetical protein